MSFLHILKLTPKPFYKNKPLVYLSASPWQKRYICKPVKQKPILVIFLLLFKL